MRLKSLLLLALLGLVPALASAQGRADAPTASGETGLFTLLSGDTLPGGQWDFGIYYNNWDPVVRQPGFVNLPVDWNQVSASVGYGLTDWWEVTVSQPWWDYSYSSSKEAPYLNNTTNGIANVHIGTKFRLFGEPGGFSTFAVNGFVEPSVGKSDFASNKTGFGGGLDWRIGDFYLNGGFAHNNYAFGGIQFPNEATAGIGYAAHVSNPLDWITEVVYTHWTKNDVPEFKDRYDFTTGIRLWLGAPREWAINLALRTDLAQLNDIPDHCPLGGVAGITYFPARTKAAPPPPPPPPPIKESIKEP